MTANRSTEELAMRNAIEAWGRIRWPDARVLHELVTDQCRIDMAFVRPEHLIGVEIKSSRDVMTRLDAQLNAFTRMIPELWLAFAPKWSESFPAQPYRAGHVIVTDGRVIQDIPSGQFSTRHLATADRTLTGPMLGLLWRGELHAVAVRKRVWSGSGKPTIAVLTAELARKLTGDEIVSEVCRELRGRDAFWRADPPIIVDGAATVVSPRTPDMFRAAAPARLASAL